MKSTRKFLIGIVFLSLALQGCTAVALKSLARSNLNEETLAQIEPCVTTRDQIVKLFRAPTDDFMKKQGENDVYIYKGFASRTDFDTQVLEIMINPEDIVVDYREPGVIRVAPVPLYNSFHDVWRFGRVLENWGRRVATTAQSNPGEGPA